jgi:hypothetical protein
MTPEISEFSYGFALTNEIVGWLNVKAAPLFPSLIEEGKEGGGYDVKLDAPGVPLYLQFKRADCMVRGTAFEHRDKGKFRKMPFYRFKITEAKKSNQHKLLLKLDDNNNLVFYAAPRFHKLAEINSAWSSNQVASRSIFVAPREIGVLDDNSHHVAYDQAEAFLFSDEPKTIPFLTSPLLLNLVLDRLKSDERPLRAKLPEMKAQMETLRRAATGERPPARQAVIETRKPVPLDQEKLALREISDIAAQLFNAQLVIMQKADKVA